MPPVHLLVPDLCSKQDGQSVTLSEFAYVVDRIFSINADDEVKSAFTELNPKQDDSDNDVDDTLLLSDIDHLPATFLDNIDEHNLSMLRNTPTECTKNPNANAIQQILSAQCAEISLYRNWIITQGLPSQQHGMRLQESIDELHHQKSQLTAELDLVSQEHSKLKLGKTKIAQSHSYIQEDYEMMAGMQDVLEADNEKLRNRNDRLQGQIEELTKTNEEAMSQIAELTQTNEAQMLAQQKMRTAHQMQLSKMEEETQRLRLIVCLHALFQIQ